MSDPVTAQIHVQHYFPKGYDSNAEPWKSIVQFVERLTNTTGNTLGEKERMESALLRIFDWARRNRPYAVQCPIEGNTLLQDICEQGLGYWPPNRAPSLQPVDKTGTSAGLEEKHYRELMKHVTANAARHPQYGPCDGLGKDGSCSECDRLSAQPTKPEEGEA